MPVATGASEPLLVERAEQLEDFQRGLMAGSRAGAARLGQPLILPPVEDFATEQLMETGVRPGWLVWAALFLTLAGGVGFLRGWLVAGLVLLVLSTPLDSIAGRLATLRLRPLATRMLSRVLLWPAFGLAVLALGWWQTRHGLGWGPLMAAVAAAAFAEAARIEGWGVAGGW